MIYLRNKCMLYKIAHILRDKLSWLWNIIEWINGVIFYMRYGKRVNNLNANLNHNHNNVVPEGYELVTMRKVPTDDLVKFFNRQPEEAYTYFMPHGFDAKSIKLLQSNKAFLGYVLLDKANGTLAGYCFNRCFFHGQGFRGRMVDINYRGKGLGIAMNKILNEVGFGIGLRLFETVSKDNVASYRSAMSASNVKVMKELEHNELYLEVLPS